MTMIRNCMRKVFGADFIPTPNDELLNRWRESSDVSAIELLVLRNQFEEYDTVDTWTETLVADR